MTSALRMNSMACHGLRRILAATIVAACMTGCAASTSIDPAQVSESDVVSVKIQTSLGPITVQVFPDAAPVTVANFLRYVDAQKYDGTTFYRTVRLDNQAASDVPIQVIQGGLFGTLQPAGSSDVPQTYPPIAHETTQQTGLKHVEGTISMARGAPGTATSEFFICIGNNPALDFGGARNPDGQGFAAFGHVIAGMDVVRQIHKLPSGKPVPEVRVMRGQILNSPVPITSVRRLPAVQHRPNRDSASPRSP